MSSTEKKIRLESISRSNPEDLFLLKLRGEGGSPSYKSRRPRERLLHSGGSVGNVFFGGGVRSTRKK